MSLDVVRRIADAVLYEDYPHLQVRQILHDLVDPMASLTLLSELMNYDFSGLSLDAPITDELIESVSGIRGLVQNIKKHIGGDTVTLGDLAGRRRHRRGVPGIVPSVFAAGLVGERRRAGADEHRGDLALVRELPPTRVRDISAVRGTIKTK